MFAHRRRRYIKSKNRSDRRRTVRAAVPFARSARANIAAPLAHARTHVHNRTRCFGRVSVGEFRFLYYVLSFVCVCVCFNVGARASAEEWWNCARRVERAIAWRRRRRRIARARTRKSRITPSGRRGRERAAIAPCPAAHTHTHTQAPANTCEGVFPSPPLQHTLLAVAAAAAADRVCTTTRTRTHEQRGHCCLAVAGASVCFSYVAAREGWARVPSPHRAVE